jgi:hypothetical protein
MAARMEKGGENLLFASRIRIIGGWRGQYDHVCEFYGCRAVIH